MSELISPSRDKRFPSVSAWECQRGEGASAPAACSCTCSTVTPVPFRAQQPGNNVLNELCEVWSITP